MKRTIILSTVILTILAGGTYAMYGQSNGQWNEQGQWMHQWRWQGQGFGKTLSTEQREKLQAMSMEERQTYVQKLRAEQGFTTQQGQGHWKWMGQGHGMNKWKGHGNWEKEHNPADMIKDIPAGTVDKTEKTFLINQYGEEKMARDLYNYAASKYSNINTFANITKSEQKHMDAIKALLDRYNIQAPSDYAKDNDLYNTLKAQIDKWEKEAIEVGITVEMVDIDNIAKDIKSTDNDDIKTILLRTGWASYNHLRGFMKALNNAGYTTDLDWKKYLSEDELNTRWPLTYKLAEKLETEWVKIPQSSKEIKEKCGKKHWEEERHWKKHWEEERHWKKHWEEERQSQWKTMHIMNIPQNYKKYVNETKVNNIKHLLKKNILVK